MTDTPTLTHIDSRGQIQMVDVTGKGIVAAMQAVEPGMFEFQLQSVVEHMYEMEGAQFLGFSTILASGPNTTVLHYGENNKPIPDSGLVLVDTGAAWQHYSADVSRTFRVSGRFSPRERELYELVLKAQNAAIDKVRVGANYYDDVHLTAKGVLEDAGYGEYFIHGAGHFLGLDVHDAGNYDRRRRQRLKHATGPAQKPIEELEQHQARRLDGDHEALQQDDDQVPDDEHQHTAPGGTGGLG